MACYGRGRGGLCVRVPSPVERQTLIKPDALRLGCYCVVSSYTKATSLSLHGIGMYGTSFNLPKIGTCPRNLPILLVSTHVTLLFFQFLFLGRENPLKTCTPAAIDFGIFTRIMIHLIWRESAGSYDPHLTHIPLRVHDPSPANSAIEEV